MKDLALWFERQARREQHTPRLEDALLGNHFGSYAWYRLRYFFARYLAACVVHGAKVLFLYHIFSRRTFVALVITHAAVGFLSSFWWGALEAMRHRVRRLRRSGRPDRIPGEVTRWLSFATTISLLASTAALVWLLWYMVYEQQRFGASHLYGLSLFLRLALECITRTLHSGVYAVRRVYRPVMAIVAVEFVGVAAVLALWPLFGRWSFPIGSIIAIVLVAVLTFYYTAQAYRFLGTTPARLFRFDRLTLTPPGSAREFFSAGFSYAVMKLDSVLVLGLSGLARPSHAGTELFVLFFAISPTIQAGFDWAQLFYFDLKRLEVKPYIYLRARYERSLYLLAWLMGGLFWAFGMVTGTTIARGFVGDLIWLLAPFFVTRSLVAFVQIRAFAARQFRELLATTILWLLAFCAISAAVTDARVQVMLLSLATAAATVLLRSAGTQSEWVATDGPVGVAEWLARLSAVDGAVRLRAVDCALPHSSQGAVKPLPDPLHWRCRRLARRIAAKLNRFGDVTYIPPARIAWYELVGDRPAFTESQLIRLGGGGIRRFHDTGSCANGAAALRTGLSWQLLGPELAQICDGDAPVNVRNTKASFAEFCPRGAVFSPDREAPAFFDELPSRERQNIMADAVRFASEFRTRARASRFDVTSLSVGGDVRLIFVVDRRVDRVTRERWGRFIKETNVRAALAAVE